MTREETSKILKIIKASWPHSFAKMTVSEMADILNLWAVMFAEDDAGLVGLTVKTMIASADYSFAPTVGQIKARMMRLQETNGIGEADAWNMVAKAVRNSGYEAAKEFNSLPDDVRRIVGSPNQLKDWSQMDSDTLHSVVASNFMRAYRARQASQREYKAIPESVKTALHGMGMRLLEEENNDAEK